MTAAVRRFTLALILIVTACAEEPRPIARERPETASACVQEVFEESRFYICSPHQGRIEIRTADSDGLPYRSFAALEASLGQRSEQVQFAMNGGMFDKEGHAIGLSIEDGRELHPINVRNGPRQFPPQAQWGVPRPPRRPRRSRREHRLRALPRRRLRDAIGADAVIDGEIHPTFEVDGPSRYERNGVGIDPKGQPVFAISQEGVSFGKFGRLFRDRLGARNALYLDGSVSSLWNPVAGRRDRSAPIGPMIVAFKPAASAPHRAAPATP